MLSKSSRAHSYVAFEECAKMALVLESELVCYLLYGQRGGDKKCFGTLHECAFNKRTGGHSERLFNRVCDIARRKAHLSGVPVKVMVLLAVASNKYQAATEKIVEHFFPGIFDVVLGEREGIPRKPDPQIVYDIMAQLHNEPLNDQMVNGQMVLYLGDSLVDRDTAANTGVPFIACSWGFVSRQALTEAGVTRIIDRPEDIVWSISERQEKVLRYLEQHNIPFTVYNHPEGKTIEEAKRWWHDDGSVHCKNIFMRNHKGDQHYLICFPCDDDLAIHDIEHWLKDILVSQGKKAPGKLSFASPERMMRYLGLEPGSVSPFGLINDTDHHVILFLDCRLKDAASLSFHPNDCRGTVVISQEAFRQYLASVGNTVEYIQTIH